MSRMETQLIQTWRGVLLFMLVITAAAVASITYALLTKEENAAYKATVRAFPTRPLSVAAMYQWCRTAQTHTMLLTSY